MAAVLLPLNDVPTGALEDWKAGRKQSEACVELVELAADVSITTLRKLRAAANNVSWEAFVSGNDDAFLALMLATIVREGAEAEAAALALLAAMRCPGSSMHGAFDALVVFELVKALRGLIADSASSGELVRELGLV